MIKHGLRWMILNLVWLVFSSNLSLSAIFVGMVSSTVILLIFRAGPSHRGDYPFEVKISLIKLLLFLPWYFGQVLKAAVKLAITICLPEPGIREYFIQIPVKFHSLNQITLFANLITLTPGTLSVNFDIKHRLLIVHCLKYTRLFSEIEAAEEITELEERFRGIFSC